MVFFVSFWSQSVIGFCQLFSVSLFLRLFPFTYFAGHFLYIYLSVSTFLLLILPLYNLTTASQLFKTLLLSSLPLQFSWPSPILQLWVYFCSVFPFFRFPSFLCYLIIFPPFFSSTSSAPFSFPSLTLLLPSSLPLLLSWFILIFTYFPFRFPVFSIDLSCVLSLSFPLCIPFSSSASPLDFRSVSFSPPARPLLQQSMVSSRHKVIISRRATWRRVGWKDYCLP